MDWIEFKKTTKPLQKKDRESPVITKLLLPRSFASNSSNIYCVKSFHKTTGHKIIIYSLHDLKKTRPEKILDLHGYTLIQAKCKLDQFLYQCVGLKWVLIITGKGNPDSSSTLKNLVPLWLQEYPIKGYGIASRLWGGEGAVFVHI